MAEIFSDAGFVAVYMYKSRHVLYIMELKQRRQPRQRQRRETKGLMSKNKLSAGTS